MSNWRCALQLDAQRRTIAGSTAALGDAIRRGADLRIGTEFRHNEHIDVDSDNPELIREVAEFGVTYLVDDRWVAGVMSLRQPISLPDGFGPRPSMSFFLYTQRRLFMLGTHPVVRVRPAIPMRYASEAWDFGWLMLRTDGHGVYRRCDPYTLGFQDIPGRYALRWFVR